MGTSIIREDYMSISKSKLIETLEQIAPLSLAESWDNCGMQIDLQPEAINKILVCLEMSKDILEEAKMKNADFIVTHHPLYFRGLKKVDCNSVIGNYTCELIKNNISVYSSHTSFDKAEKGNNYHLAKLLGLDDLKSFEDISTDYIGVYGIFNKPITLKALLIKLSDVLDIPAEELRYIGDLSAAIDKIGLCTGAGVETCAIAQKIGCQVFITGDVKHHDAVDAMEMGMNVIDAGHYGTEKIFISNMAAQLRELLGNKVEIMGAESNRNPFDFL